jgi:hypothetical protein
MDTTESSAPHAHPPAEDHADTVEAHYSGLERLRPCACMNGTVFIGHLVVGEDGDEVEHWEPCEQKTCGGSSLTVATAYRRSNYEWCCRQPLESFVTTFTNKTMFATQGDQRGTNVLYRITVGSVGGAGERSPFGQSSSQSPTSSI